MCVFVCNELLHTAAEVECWFQQVACGAGLKEEGEKSRKTKKKKADHSFMSNFETFKIWQILAVKTEEIAEELEMLFVYSDASIVNDD